MKYLFRYSKITNINKPLLVLLFVLISNLINAQSFPVFTSVDELESHLTNIPDTIETMILKSNSDHYLKKNNYLKLGLNNDLFAEYENQRLKIGCDSQELSFKDGKLSGIQRFYMSNNLIYEFYIFEDNVLYDAFYLNSDKGEYFKNYYDSRVYFVLALEKMKLEIYDEAIQNLDKAIKLDPSVAEYYYLKAFSLYTTRSSEHNLIYSNIIKAIELHPNEPKYHYLKGETEILMAYYTKSDGWLPDAMISNSMDKIKIFKKSYDSFNLAKELGYPSEIEIKLKYVNEYITNEQNFISKLKSEANQKSVGNPQKPVSNNSSAKDAEVAALISNMLKETLNSMVQGATGEWKKNPKLCRYCKGVGVVKVCPLCEKRGKIICKNCKGKRILYDGTTCIKCLGTGIQVCDGCKGKIYNIKCQHTLWQFQK